MQQGTDQQQNDIYSETETDMRRESTGSYVGLKDVDLRPDGDERFRAAVRAAAKSGPKHRPTKEAKA